MLTKALHHAGHTHRFVVSQAGEAGWEVREERDGQPVRVRRYRDWHRVERAIMWVEARIAELEARGWTARSSVDEAVAHADDRLDL